MSDHDIDTSRQTDPILPEYRDATGKAHSVEGQTCGVCGAPAWHAQAMPFCRSHDQRSFGRIPLTELGEFFQEDAR